MEIPCKPHPRLKYARAATKSVPLKMSAVTPPIAVAREILTRSFDWLGERSLCTRQATKSLDVEAQQAQEIVRQRQFQISPSS